MVVISMTKGCCFLCRYWEKSQFAKKTGFFPSSTSCSLFGRSFCFLNRLHAIEHYYNMNLITTKDKMLMSWHEMASCVWSQWGSAQFWLKSHILWRWNDSTNSNKKVANHHHLRRVFLIFLSHHKRKLCICKVQPPPVLFSPFLVPDKYYNWKGFFDAKQWYFFTRSRQAYAAGLCLEHASNI